MPRRSGCVCCGGCATQVRQILMLLYKNLLVTFREFYWTLSFLIWVGAITAVIWAAYKAGPPASAPPGCISMVYSPSGDPSVFSIMRAFAQLNNLSIAPNASDTSQNYDVVAFSAFSEIESYYSNVERFLVITAAINWNDTSNYYEPDHYTAGPAYTILVPEFNSPLMRPKFSAIPLQRVQLAIDRAILYSTSGQDIELEVTEKPAMTIVGSPFSQDSQSPANASDTFVTWFGLAALILVALWVHVGSVISTLNNDRSKEIRVGLRMMGLQTFPYFFSIFIHHAILAIFTSLIITLGGYLGKVEIFANSPFFLMWLLIYLTATSMITFAMWLGTWIHRPAVNNGFMIVSLLLAVALGIVSSVPYIYPQLWANSGTTAICSIFFPFHLGSMITHMSARAQTGGTFYNSTTGVPGYHWSDLYDPSISPSTSSFYNSSTLKPVYFFAFLAIDTVLALFFTWYFDSVWPGATGVPQGLFFFLKPSYWGLTEATPTVSTNEFDAKRINNVVMDLDPDVNREYDEAVAMANSRSEEAIIKVLKLCKTFQTGRVGNRKDHRALDFISLTAKRNSVLAILGHNGSGKTTMINILTGVFAPSFGDAFIGPYSIQRNIQAIRRMIGVCPQKDILWDSMTPREHLKLFCLLKAVPWKDHDEVIRETLKSVRLEQKIDVRVGTFSGGMKRRLCVAIATIGDPIAIFLDEPTAGLDPANRRELWKVIERLKENRAIILTSHSMQEADHLADKIAILAMGRLRAVGDSLHLKQRFGAGYHLSLTTDNSRVEELKSRVAELLPEAHLDMENSGQLGYSLARARAAQLTKFFAWLESVSSKSSTSSTSSSESLVKDFGLSQTTLEEVFIRLTHGDALLRQIMTNNPNDENQDNPDGVLKLQQLNVAVDGDGQAIGFITVDAETDLATARRLIRAELINTAPRQFAFLRNGIPVAEQQEQKLLAADFVPMVVLKDLGAGVGPIVSGPDSDFDHSRPPRRAGSDPVHNEEVVALKQEVTHLQQLIQQAEARFEEAQCQWRQREEQLLQRITQLESMAN